jgi:hypothetical protein
MSIETAPVTHWPVGWVGPSANLGILEKVKIIVMMLIWSGKAKDFDP